MAAKTLSEKGSSCLQLVQVLGTTSLTGEPTWSEQATAVFGQCYVSTEQPFRSFTVSFKSRACVAMSHLGLKKARGLKFSLGLNLNLLSTAI